MVMKENEYSRKAGKLFCEGYNCAQSVFCAFSDDLGINFETALKLSSSFGGGMGRLREVCGAVSAMFMIAGLNTVIHHRMMIKLRHSTTQEFNNLLKNSKK